MEHCRAWLVALFLTLNAANAQERKPPDTLEQAADRVLVAFKAKDEKALRALAEKDKPDPWLVADELCFRAEHDAAAAFAAAWPTAPRTTSDSRLLRIASASMTCTRRS